MYTIFFYCRARDDREREQMRRYLEQTLVPLLPAHTAPTVTVAADDPNHIRVLVTWQDRDECLSFLREGAWEEWRAGAARHGLRLRGPLNAQRLDEDLSA